MSDQNKNPLAVNSDAFYFEKDKSDKVLLLGIGNFLMGDEGVGVHVVEALAKQNLPDYLDLIDGGTGGFLLLNCFESYPKIVLIDATMDGRPAGTVNLIKPRFASDFPSALSVHDVGLKDMIEAVYLMDNVPEMFLFTISIDRIKPMTVSLSKKVKQAIPAVIDQILTLAKELQSEVV
jgi:hydrogenase maturation protease